MDKDGRKPNNVWPKRHKQKVLFIVFIFLVILGVGAGVTLHASDNPAFCSYCHNMSPYYQSYQNSNLLAHTHAQAGVVCHDCHETSITAKVDEVIRYVTSNYETPMKQRNYSKELCLKCHKDFNAIIKKTSVFGKSNPHQSHFGRMECYECHRMHRQSNVMCAQCHQFPWFKDLNSSWKQSGK